ncbi:MAG: hypothetical protein D6791_12640, partial [Chloroflexi bacterium]
MRKRYITFHVWQTTISFDGHWLLLVPLILWLVATLYVPVMAPSLSQTEAWGLAAGITLLILGSLLGHALAHAWAARVVAGNRESRLPAHVPIYAFGDAAQVWPAAPTLGHEALIALAGPAASLLLASIGYLIWDRQLHPYLNVSGIFLAGINAGLALVNLAPGFPLDGGRLVRVIVWGLLQRPAQASRLGTRLGRLMTAALAAWGIVLILQRARFSLETGAGTLLAAAILGLALWQQPAWQWDRPVTTQAATRSSDFLHQVIAGLLILGMLSVGISLVPMNNGLEAPGVALAVEPMVEVPPEYRHPYAGSFILTTVFPQTPITVGQWVYGKLSPVVKIVPPERVVPPDTTPQKMAEEGT